MMAFPLSCFVFGYFLLHPQSQLECFEIIFVSLHQYAIMISAVITAKLECFVFGYFCVTNSAYLDVTRLGDF